MQNNLLKTAQKIDKIICNYKENNNSNEDIKVEIIPSKSLATSKIQVTQKFGKNIFGDIDILEIKRDVRLVERYLRDLGYDNPSLSINVCEKDRFALYINGLIIIKYETLSIEGLIYFLCKYRICYLSTGTFGTQEYRFMNQFRK